MKFLMINFDNSFSLPAFHFCSATLFFLWWIVVDFIENKKVPR
nr:MAG TPA: hypothetical protein [Caudoviricetes sp.]